MPIEDSEVEVRPFEPRRRAKTKRAKVLVREIVRYLEAEGAPRLAPPSPQARGSERSSRRRSSVPRPLPS